MRLEFGHCNLKSTLYIYQRIRNFTSEFESKERTSRFKSCSVIKTCLCVLLVPQVVYDNYVNPTAMTIGTQKKTCKHPNQVMIWG